MYPLLIAGKYTAAFLLDGYDDLESVCYMTAADLMEIEGMKRGHQKKISRAITRQSPAATAVTSLHPVDLSAQLSEAKKLQLATEKELQDAKKARALWLLMPRKPRT